MGRQFRALPVDSSTDIDNRAMPAEPGPCKIFKDGIEGSNGVLA